MYDMNYNKHVASQITQIISKGCIAIIFILFLFIVIFAHPLNQVMDKRTIVATVTDKTNKITNNDDTYLIFCEDTEGKSYVFEISDNLFAWRWNSSDLYSSIKVNKTYEFTIAGSRIHFLSWYPNIYKVAEVGEDACSKAP